MQVDPMLLLKFTVLGVDQFIFKIRCIFFLFCDIQIEWVSDQTVFRKLGIL